MIVRYTLPALVDLELLIDHVAQRSLQSARRILLEIRAAERRIELYPRSGASTSRPTIRRVKVPRCPYLIFYEPTDSEIIIHAIRHGARDPATMPADR